MSRGRLTKPDFWDLPIQTLFEQLKTASNGLTEEQAQQKREIWGPNLLTARLKKNRKRRLS